MTDLAETTPPCTCHPDDRPPVCQRRYAAGECIAAAAAREAGLLARRTALEDAKAALKDLWFGDEVARPGSLDAIEAIDALIAAAPTCNGSLQVQAEAGTVKLDLTIDAASDVGLTLSTPNVDVIRDAALEEAANVATEHMRRAELILSKPDPELNELNAMFFEVEADTAADIAIAIRALRGAA